MEHNKWYDASVIYGTSTLVHIHVSYLPLPSKSGPMWVMDLSTGLNQISLLDEHGMEFHKRSRYSFVRPATYISQPFIIYDLLPTSSRQRDSWSHYSFCVLLMQVLQRVVRVHNMKERRVQYTVCQCAGCNNYLDDWLKLIDHAGMYASHARASTHASR